MSAEIEHPLVKAAREAHLAALRAQRNNTRDDEQRTRRTAQELDDVREAFRDWGPVRLNNDHRTLLRASRWGYNDFMEFGAAMMDPKRPYGNSDVMGDLEELLPHLGEIERRAVHHELPLVLPELLREALGDDPRSDERDD